MNIKFCDQKDDGESWLKRRNAKAFYQAIVAPTVRQGSSALLQVSTPRFALSIIISLMSFCFAYSPLISLRRISKDFGRKNRLIVRSSVWAWAKCDRMLFFSVLKMIG